MAKLLGFRDGEPQQALAGNAVTKFVWGNTSMTFKTAADHLTMLTALVAIGYIGYAAYKDFRGKRGRHN